jgi:hypothetical protein
VVSPCDRIRSWHSGQGYCTVQTLSVRKRGVVCGVRIVDVYHYPFDGITGVFGVFTRLATHDVSVQVFAHSCEGYS